MVIMQMSPPSQLPGSQGQIARDRIVAAIAAGQLKPGDRLREVELAASFGLSRTPIREALRMLEAERIVEHAPRIGAVIRRLGHAEVVELYEIRLAIERTAAGMAAKHCLAAETETMAGLNAALRAAVAAPERAAAINQEFHACLYLAARNRFLIDATRSLNSALMLLGPTTLADAARIEEVCAQHEEIIEAIRRGDIAAAEDAAERHLATSLAHRLKALHG